MILSANELQSITDWPPALIEDYLNIIENMLLLAAAADEDTALAYSHPSPTDVTSKLNEITKGIYSLPTPKDFDKAISDLAEMPYHVPSERSYDKEIEELRAVVMMNLPTVEPKYVLSDAKQLFYAGF